MLQRTLLEHAKPVHVGVALVRWDRRQRVHAAVGLDHLDRRLARDSEHEQLDPAAVSARTPRLQQLPEPAAVGPVVEDAKGAVADRHEHVVGELALGLDVLDVLAHLHVVLDDDSEKEVEHEEELDDDGEGDVDDQQRVLVILGRKVPEEHVELRLHRRLQILELSACSEAPRRHHRREAEDEEEEDRVVPDVIEPGFDSADQHADARVDGGSVDDADEHEHHHKEAQRLQHLLRCQQHPHRHDRLEEHVHLCLDRLGAVAEGNVDKLHHQRLSLQASSTPRFSVANIAHAPVSLPSTPHFCGEIPGTNPSEKESSLEKGWVLVCNLGAAARSYAWRDLKPHPQRLIALGSWRFRTLPAARLALSRRCTRPRARCPTRGSGTPAPP
mmetsp:Transcript_57878/g.135907  ORF Transcript_57878/g.135907 Transcript_57878/m.135907 type:complete len:386 (+) Transcript_57878:713-1870(+)